MDNKYINKLSLLKQRFILTLKSLLILILLSSCDEQSWHQDLIPGIPPQPVTNVSVISEAGKAQISYDLPDKNVLYIMAEYETREGVKMDAKASRYVQSLTVEGFARAGAYDVSLYSVGLNEERSDPVVVSVEVNEPPVVATFETMDVVEDFGGITVQAVNEFEGELVFEVFTKDEHGDLSLDHAYYTKQKNIRFSARGYAAEQQEFYIAMRDRWGNGTDTLSMELLPFFEQKLDRNLMEEVRLPTDNWQGHKRNCTESNPLYAEIQITGVKFFIPYLTRASPRILLLIWARRPSLAGINCGRDGKAPIISMRGLLPESGNCMAAMIRILMEAGIAGPYWMNMK